jgi:hypothetical protein
MRRFALPATLVVTFVLGCTAATVAQTSAVAAPPDSAPAAAPNAAAADTQRFEYMELRPPISQEKRLTKMNQLGAQGWELVGLFAGDYLVFKRPVG